MRVQVSTIEDFCSELAAEAADDAVFCNLIRLRVERMPEQQEAISFQVGFWATAVIRRADGSEWLLELERLAGSDEGSDDTGSETAADWRKQIETVALAHKLDVRPGKIEVW